MILGNGDIVTGSKDESPHLLNGAAGALGTLGIITLLELRLVPAKRFVHIFYHQTTSIEETINMAQAETYDANNNYVDAVMFSDTEGIVIRQINCLIASGLRLSVVPGIHGTIYTRRKKEALLRIRN
ncbi:hypothetical protein EV127DRAFT_420924 [Xylaria flabelliformis]|nr:hypothetical protein EV127DRAFT_420924 [Xylaria flabelliformis]